MNKPISSFKALCNKNEEGAALVTGLLLVLVLTILTMVAMATTSTELKISANDRSAKRVFYVAEAGTEDARSRLQIAASTFPIPDDQPTNAYWKAFIGTSPDAALQGYTGSTNQVLYPKLNSSLDYLVTITHKLNSSNQILKWAYSNGTLVENTSVGNNIFVITSLGKDATGSSKSVQIEATNLAINAPAALYTKEHTTIQGNSVYVEGMDQCGSSNVYGVLSVQDVNTLGGPYINGSPQPVQQFSAVNIGIQDLITQFKHYANYNYTVNSANLTGMDWGSPIPGATPENASTCNAKNVVYIDTQSTFVRLDGMSHGCGMLLVNGDLAVHGGFHWYGVVLVTGSVTFTGGGEKNVTGAMLVGGTASADLVGGDASIVYCSRAIYDDSRYLPLITLRWVELFS